MAGDFPTNELFVGNSRQWFQQTFPGNTQVFGPGQVTITPPPIIGPDQGANTAADLDRAAVKFDGGKVRWDLMPWDALSEVAKLYTAGALKYEENNWLKGFRYGRTVAALQRHLIDDWWLAPLAGKDGIDKDMVERFQQLGYAPPSHLVAVVWNALALLTFELRGLGTDDRPGVK